MQAAATQQIENVVNSRTVETNRFIQSEEMGILKHQLLNYTVENLNCSEEEKSQIKTDLSPLISKLIMAIIFVLKDAIDIDFYKMSVNYVITEADNWLHQRRYIYPYVNRISSEQRISIMKLFFKKFLLDQNADIPRLDCIKIPYIGIIKLDNNGLLTVTPIEDHIKIF